MDQYKFNATVNFKMTVRFDIPVARRVDTQRTISIAPICVSDASYNSLERLLAKQEIYIERNNSEQKVCYTRNDEEVISSLPIAAIDLSNTHSCRIQSYQLRGQDIEITLENFQHDKNDRLTTISERGLSVEIKYKGKSDPHTVAQNVNTALIQAYTAKKAKTKPAV